MVVLVALGIYSIGSQSPASRIPKVKQLGALPVV